MQQKGRSACLSKTSLVSLSLGTAAAIFLAEAGTMFLLDGVPSISGPAAALAAAALLGSVCLPLLHFTWVRSLRRAIAERERALQALEQQALRDPLTRLPNRISFEDNAGRELERARLERVSLALLVVDVRRFAQINRALGHKHGDQLLLQIADRLRRSLPHPELVTRLGSDVFGVLLREVSAERAVDAAERIHQIIDAPYAIEGHAVEIEAHCGVSLYPDHAQQAGVLLQCAEIALQRAKEVGERHQIYRDDDPSRARRHLDLFSLLRGALQRGELSLRYQPKLDLANGRVTSAEALLRWHHPELGQVPPCEFIGVAEQTSLIKPITAWVLEQAVRQVAAWAAEGLHVRVAVNLSARSLTDQALPGELASLLLKWRVNPASIVVEVTESAVLAEPDSAAGVIERLCELGVELSIDDFGTGYSSLTYLRMLPARELKIDRSFAQNVDSNQENAVIVRAVVELAHNFGLRVVAEGVETRAAFERLSALGCDLVQGYYVSKPLTAQDFAEFVRAQGVSPSPRRASLFPLPSDPTRLVAPIRSVPPLLRESLRSLRAVAPRRSIPA
jgi:diguanylate cyclase (GGDEF)-like protein